MDDTQKLNENLEKLNENLEKQVSLRFVILKGVVYGLGTVIGASIVAGIGFSLLGMTFDRAEQLPSIENVGQ